MPIVSFTYTPSPRYPPLDTPWIGVRISETDAPDGSLSLIDTITFDDPDDDPAEPQSRRSSSAAATLDAGWYLLTIFDAAGNEQHIGPVAYPLDPIDPTVAGAIATLGELKDDLGIERDDGDARLTSILAGVSQRVETYCGRLFHPVPALDANGEDTLDPVIETVYVPRRFWNPWALPRQATIVIPDARVITSVTATGCSISGWEHLGNAPWRRIRLFGLSVPEQFDTTTLPKVDIVGRFGLWPAPEDLHDAVLAMASRRWREKDAAYGDTVQLPEGGIVSYFRQFPPSVQATLDSYARKVRLP